MLDPADEDGKAQFKKATPLDWIQMHISRGQLHAYKGEMTKAIVQYEAAYRTASTDAPQMLPTLEESLGILHLHAAEMENDVYRNPGERCLFPMSPAMRYRETAHSEKAVQHFLKFLAGQPDSIEVKWLLNVAEMTLGAYPGGVPPSYLLPLSLFASRESIGRFTDVAPAVGLNLFAMASGVVVDDFDNDGLVDVMTSTYEPCAPMHYFHNNGDGTFADGSAAAGLSDQLGGLNLIQADYKVTVKNEGKGTRAIYSTVGSQSSFGGSPLRQHIGLGKSAQIQQIEIRWPGNPVTQVFSKVGKNQFIEIKEFATQYTKLDYFPYRLGGPNRPDAARGGASARVPR